MVLLGFALAISLALAFTPVARHVALRWNIVDHPSDRKIHVRPTALLGGAAFFVAVAVPLVLFGGTKREILGLVVGGGLFLVIGLVDDLRGIGAIKLLLEFLAALAVLEMTDTVFHLPSRLAEIALTACWIVGVVNAFNCMDCADGAAVGSALPAAGAFMMIGIATDQPVAILFGAAILGASLGFLRYNLAPAQIFLGDAGSLLLGYLLAMLGVMLSPGMISVSGLVAPAVVLAVPIYDILLVHGKRYRHGQRALRQLLTSTGKDHLPHRLTGRGYSARGTMTVIVLASVSAGAAGVALVAMNSLPATLIIGMLVAGTLMLMERRWSGSIRASRFAPEPRVSTPDGS